MAEKEKPKVAPPECRPETQAAGRAALRRAAALEILNAFVTKHGGFAPESMEAHVLQVWRYADLFAALEDDPRGTLTPDDLAPAAVPQARPRPGRPTRAAHPADEWAVVGPGDDFRRGFVTWDEAANHAEKRAGSAIKQVSGPGAATAFVAAPAVA